MSFSILRSDRRDSAVRSEHGQRHARGSSRLGALHRRAHKGRVIYELGNELYGRWQVGYKTVDEIAPSTLALQPGGARGCIPTRRSSPPAWARCLTENGMPRSSPIPLEHSTTSRCTSSWGQIIPRWRQATPDFTAAAAYALPYAVGPYFDKVQAQIDEHPELHGKVHLAVTEWLFNSKGYGERNFTDESPSWMNEGGAVMAAGFLNTVLRHASEDQNHRHDRHHGVCRHLEEARAGLRRARVLRLQNVHGREGRHRVAGDHRLRNLQREGRRAAAG